MSLWRSISTLDAPEVSPFHSLFLSLTPLPVICSYYHFSDPFFLQFLVFYDVLYSVTVFCSVFFHLFHNFPLSVLLCFSLLSLAVVFITRSSTQAVSPPQLERDVPWKAAVLQESCRSNPKHQPLGTERHLGIYPRLNSTRKEKKEKKGYRK